MISKQEKDTPGDNHLSSGASIVRGNMVKIDNYANVSKYINNRTFSFLDRIEILQDEEEYPQGLCFTEDYVLISSYSGIRNELGKIKIYDRTTGEYLISLGMDEDSHLGGLTFDGKYIWVCNSSKMAIERLPYALIQQMVRDNKGQIIDIRNLVDMYHVNNIPSCITYYDGQLWIATHSIWTNAIMIGYHYDEIENRLYSLSSFWIPSKVQGVTFSEKGEVYLSTSYGRKNDSYIKKYESVYVMSKDVHDYIEKIKLPPCAEEIVYKDKKLYVLFESAGKKYLEGTDGKGKSIAPINKILIIEE